MLYRIDYCLLPVKHMFQQLPIGVDYYNTVSRTFVLMDLHEGLACDSCDSLEEEEKEEVMAYQ